MFRPSKLPSLDHPNNKAFLAVFSSLLLPAPCYATFPSSTLCCRMLQSSPLNVREQVLHMYKAAGKIIVAYLLIHLNSGRCLYMYDNLNLYIICGPGSSVGIATDYGLDGPGIGSRWGRDFLPSQTGPGANPVSCNENTGSFMVVKCGRCVLLTTHPHLVPPSWKSRSILLPTLWATPGL